MYSFHCLNSLLYSHRGYFVQTSVGLITLLYLMRRLFSKYTKYTLIIQQTLKGRYVNILWTNKKHSLFDYKFLCPNLFLMYQIRVHETIDQPCLSKRVETSPILAILTPSPLKNV